MTGYELISEMELQGLTIYEGGEGDYDTDAENHTYSVDFEEYADCYEEESDFLDDIDSTMALILGDCGYKVSWVQEFTHFNVYK